MKTGQLLACFVSLIIISNAFAQSSKFQSGIFLHHSTGGRIWGQYGSKTTVPLEVAAYNARKGLTGQNAASLSELSWPPAGDNEWERWHRIFANQDTVVEDIRPILDTNRIVIVKSCFPSSQMTGYGKASDTLTPTVQTLSNYKWHWRNILRVMKQRTTNFFVIWTNAPLVASVTDDQQAKLAHEFCRWAKDTLARGLDPQFGAFPSNVYVFDFFHKLVGADWKLPLKYASDSSDSHPNAAATDLIAPQFVREVFDAALAIPDPPLLLSPEDGAIGVPKNAPVQWSPAVRATSYRLQLSTNSNFTSILIEDSSITTQSKLVGPLPSHTLLFWRVSAHNVSGYSAFSRVRSFTTVNQIPEAPVIIFPANGARGVNPYAVIRWKASDYAVNYHFQLSNDQTFSSFLVNDSLVGNTFYQASQLIRETAYSWRVRAMNSVGKSVFSDASTFQTVPNDLRAPLPLLPPEGASGVLRQPTFRWSADNGTITMLTPFPLAENTRYFWRVRTANIAGITSFTDVRSFTTGPGGGVSTLGSVDGKEKSQIHVLGKYSGAVSDSEVTYHVQISTSPSFETAVINDSSLVPPLPPALLDPPDAASTVSTMPVLRWNAGGHVSLFRVHVWSDQALAEGLVDTNVNSSSLSISRSLSGNTVYSWQVAALGNGSLNAWSVTRMFKTTLAPPSLPRLLSPNHKAANIDTSVSLCWRASMSATSYHLVLSADSEFTIKNVVLDKNELTDTTYKLPKLNPGTIYYWHVSASNPGGESEFSQTWQFTTKVISSVEKRGEGIPSSFELSQNYPNPFNPETAILFALPRSSHVTLAVYNLLGKEIETLVSQELGPGYFTVRWRTNVPSGLYLCRIQAGELMATRKMLLVK